MSPTWNNASDCIGCPLKCSAASTNLSKAAALSPRCIAALAASYATRPAAPSPFWGVVSTGSKGAESESAAIAPVVVVVSNSSIVADRIDSTNSIRRIFMVVVATKWRGGMSCLVIGVMVA
jgi:hypothetical protein